MEYFFHMPELQSPVQEKRRGKIVNEWGVNFILTEWAGLKCPWQVLNVFFDSMFGLQGEAVNNCLKYVMYKKLKVIKNLCLIKCCGQIEDQNAVCRTNVRSTWPSPRSSLSKVLLWSTMRNSVATGRNQHIPKTLTLSGISKRARNQSNQLAVRMILPA